MKFLKLWYAACVVFCLYSLRTLINESYEVHNLVDNRNETKPVFLICEELARLGLKKTEFTSEELRSYLTKNSIVQLNIVLQEDETSLISKDLF